MPFCGSEREGSRILKPHRFGIACSNGAEKIAHDLRACVNKYWLDDDFVVLGGHEERLQYGLTGGYPLRV